MRELLNEKQASAVLALSVASLRQRRYEGRPPAYLKFDKAVRYERAELERYIEACRVRPHNSSS